MLDSMKALVQWTLNLVSAMAALLGTFLVIFLSVDVYFLATGRIQPDMDQPPLAVVVPVLLFGIFLLVGGLSLQKWLHKDNPF